jgi:hypothetical protein
MGQGGLSDTGCCAYLGALNDVLAAEAFIIGPLTTPEHLQQQQQQQQQRSELPHNATPATKAAAGRMWYCVAM